MMYELTPNWTGTYESLAMVRERLNDAEITLGWNESYVHNETTLVEIVPPQTGVATDRIMCRVSHWDGLGIRAKMASLLGASVREIRKRNSSAVGGNPSGSGVQPGGSSSPGPTSG